MGSVKRFLVVLLSTIAFAATGITVYQSANWIFDAIGRTFFLGTIALVFTFLCFYGVYEFLTNSDLSLNIRDHMPDFSRISKRQK